MKKIYKESYHAPEAKCLVLSQSLSLLVGFSIDGDIENPEADTDWGESAKRSNNGWFQ